MKNYELGIGALYVIARNEVTRNDAKQSSITTANS